MARKYERRDFDKHLVKQTIVEQAEAGSAASSIGVEEHYDGVRTFHIHASKGHLLRKIVCNWRLEFDSLHMGKPAFAVTTRTI